LNVLDTSVLFDLFRGSEEAKGFIDDEAVATTIAYYEIFQRIKRGTSLILGDYGMPSIPSLSAIPHSSPNSTPISIPGSILLNPAYMMRMSCSAEMTLPGSARRTWLSRGSLISSPYLPSMPISKVIS
jgi:hypothetical protein